MAKKYRDFNKELTSVEDTTVETVDEEKVTEEIVEDDVKTDEEVEDVVVAPNIQEVELENKNNTTYVTTVITGSTPVVVPDVFDPVVNTGNITVMIKGVYDKTKTTIACKKLDKFGISYEVENNNIMVGKFESNEEAAKMRKSLISKGFKCEIVER